MKQYMLSFVTPTGIDPPGPDAMDQIVSELEVIRNELKASGAWVFGDGLASPSTATMVRLSGQEVLTIDGPFAEGKEYIGGLTIIRAADLDEALGWARRYARATTLGVEVRPFLTEVEG